MPRKARPLDRDGGARDRDASLIVIASEDTYAVDDYFTRFKTHRVQFKPLVTSDDGKSAPQHVLDRLERFTREYDTQDGDTFWLCIDRNSWHKEPLERVLRRCLELNYGIALSNPCWNLWILLHFEDVSADSRTCEDVSDRILQVAGTGIGKKGCRTIGITEEMVLRAIGRARALDPKTADLVPAGTMTHVYKILDLLLEKERIEFV